MRYLTHTLLVACLLVLGSTQVQGQATKYAQAGMAFLKIDPGARLSAMGSTQTGAVGTASAMFGNPAGLALLEGGEATFGVTQWIADIDLYSVAAAYRVGNMGVFGVNFVSMDYGTFNKTIPYNGSDADLRNQGYVDLGTFEVGEYAVGLSYARQITNQFYVGGNLKVANQDLGDVEIINAFTGATAEVGNELTNVVFDFGTLYYPGWRDLRFGVSFRNFSNQNDYFDQRFELPLTFEFGAAMDVLSLASSAPENSQLTLALDWLHPRDYEERLHVGLEYGFMDMFFVRGGYKYNYDEEDLTAGLGVNVSAGGFGIAADYAWNNFGTFFGSVNRINVGILLP